MVAELEFEYRGRTYRAGKLSGLRQWNVARRLSPISMALAETYRAMAAAGGADKVAGDPSVLLRTFSPLLMVVGSLADADSDYVIGECLSVVHRREPAGWAPVSARGRLLMYEDLDDMASMLFLVWKVMEHNLANFTAALSFD